MTQHIGGPESPEKISKRLELYCRDSSVSNIHMFVIVLMPEKTGIGSVGYWEREWRGQLIWEGGWRIVPDFQGKGIASKAIAFIIERARAERKHRYLHAFPSIQNDPSNAICRKMGFVLQEEVDFEYPPGRWVRSNDWCLDLFSNAPVDPHPQTS